MMLFGLSLKNVKSIAHALYYTYLWRVFFIVLQLKFL